MKGSKLKVLRAVVALERFTVADVTGWTGLESSQVIPQIARLCDDGVIEHDTDQSKGGDKPRPAHRPARHYRICAEASLRQKAFGEIRALRAAVGEDPSAQRLSIVQGQLEALQRLSKSFRDRAQIAEYQVELQSIETTLDETILEVDQEDDELNRRIEALRRFHQSLRSGAVPPRQAVFVRPMRVFVGLRTMAEKGFRSRVSMPAPALAPGLPMTPEHDLIFHGGHTIADLMFVNFYVGGSEAWQESDMTSIDRALAAAMSDRGLNNVMSQYYPSGRITSTFHGSQVLAGPPPRLVSQGDVENLIKSLLQVGTLGGFDLTSTVFNFILPSGTVLNTNEAPTSGTISAYLEQVQEREQVEHRSSSFVPPGAKEEDSTQGLGGYHGSVHVGSGPSAQTIYYAVGVFSETLPDGTVNGIPVFDQPWKNVVATLYHQLNEARTDPDVQDAIRAGDDPRAISFLGWTSRHGEECGDFPVLEANPLYTVFMEVELADGSGTVPVQLQYSDVDHGPGEPRDEPAPFAGALRLGMQQIAG